MTHIAVYTRTHTYTYELDSITLPARAWAVAEIETLHPDWDEYELVVELPDVTYFVVE